MAAKWCPNVTHLLVRTKSRPFSRRSAGGGRHGVREDLLGDKKFEKKGVPQRVTAQRCHYQPHGADGFATMQRQSSQRQRSQRSNGNPDQSFAQFHENVSAFNGLAILPKPRAMRNVMPWSSFNFRTVMLLTGGRGPVHYGISQTFA